MNKTALIQKIVAQLESELALFAKSARAAHEEATHEQSKAENKYDTRGLEASYLAHGQSRLAAETESAWQLYDQMVARPYQAGEGIDLGALVELEAQPHREHSFYFIGPKAGGTEVELDGTSVIVMTPQSPLGRQLMGQREGGKLTIEIARQRTVYKIVSVS